MRDQCPHRGVALSAGDVRGDCIVCPFHGFEFDPGGACRLIPANGRHGPLPKAMHVHTYPTREAHGFIWLWWGDLRADLPPIRFFESIDETFSYATIQDPWAAHYSRAIENQLDVVHLPFVHRTTIGRGNRTLINGPLTEWDDTYSDANRLNVWVSNVHDEGQPPLSPQQLPRPDRHPQLQFQFPNVWHNWISDNVRIVVAFVPVDDENTILYLRFYQNSVRTPLVRETFNRLAMPFNLLVARQDRRVVVTQMPKRSDLKIGETLIQGDGPIIEYRKRRRALIEESGQQQPVR
jgi:phenylpropionate dioxygenase-like ring-hydroxylating dioxygenase large terminal subunit